jgi:formate dehydrogenase maturation protein FdhE
VQRLQAAAKNSPDLRVAARLYEAILPLLRDNDLMAAPLTIAPEQVHELMETGVPLLSGLMLDINIQAAGELMQQLLRAVEAIVENDRSHSRWLFWLRSSHQLNSDNKTEFASLQSAANQIRCAFEMNKLDIVEILTFAATGNCMGMSETAQSKQLDPYLLWTIAQNSIKPALHSWRRQIHPPPNEIHWHHGYCFVCGATATLGELQDNNQAKHLRCGQCGADWPFPILQCLQCGNEDHSSKSHFYMDGHNTGRVEACDVCHSYLKVITAFTPTKPELLVVEDLVSLHLDFIARQRGYVNATSRYNRCAQDPYKLPVKAKPLSENKSINSEEALLS